MKMLNDDTILPMIVVQYWYHHTFYKKQDDSLKKVDISVIKIKVMYKFITHL